MAELQAHHLAKAAWEGWVYGRRRAENETLTDEFARGVVSGTEGERLPGQRPDSPAELYWSIVGRPCRYDSDIVQPAMRLASVWDITADESYRLTLKARAYEYLARWYSSMKIEREYQLFDDKQAAFARKDES